MTKKTKIAIIQTKVSNNEKFNIKNSIDKIKLAAKKKAKIICLPELFLSPYFCQTENHSKFKLAAKLSNNAEPRLALAISSYSMKGISIETLNIAKNALMDNPKYADIEYQSEQLWGRKLQDSAKLFFKTKEMKKVVREAREKTE